MLLLVFRAIEVGGGWLGKRGVFQLRVTVSGLLLPTLSCLPVSDSLTSSKFPY